MHPERLWVLENCITIHMYKTTKLEQACRSWNSWMDLKSGLFGNKFCWELQSVASNISNQIAESTAPGEMHKEHNQKRTKWLFNFHCLEILYHVTTWKKKKVLNGERSLQDCYALFNLFYIGCVWCILLKWEMRDFLKWMLLKRWVWLNNLYTYWRQKEVSHSFSPPQPPSSSFYDPAAF